MDVETREKTVVTREDGDPLLKKLFHPSQLEKRFGGEAPSPDNYWPPYIGPHFIPEDDADERNLIKDEDYLQVLKENPDLPCPPTLLEQAGLKSSRDFIIPSAQTTTATRAETT